jgi:hypothetical protein
MSDHTAPQLSPWASPRRWPHVVPCTALAAGLIWAIGQASLDGDGTPSVPLRDPEIDRLYARITPGTAGQVQAELEKRERQIAMPLPVRQVLEYNRKLEPILVRFGPLRGHNSTAADGDRSLQALERRCATEHPGEPLLTVAIKLVNPSGRESRTLFRYRDEPDRWSLLGLLDEIRNQLLGRRSARAQDLEPLDHTPAAPCPDDSAPSPECDPNVRRSRKPGIRRSRDHSREARDRSRTGEWSAKPVAAVDQAEPSGARRPRPDRRR